MKPANSSRDRQAFLLPIAIAVLALAGCAIPGSSPYDNPLDPYGNSYVMQFPLIFPPVANTARQVTITAYAIDPYASLLLVERSPASTGVFVQVGSAPASQGVFVDTVPVGLGPTLWYRVRLQGPAGSLSPYSSALYVTLP